MVKGLRLYHLGDDFVELLAMLYPFCIILIINNITSPISMPNMANHEQYLASPMVNY
jgi:hypothetical protein